MWCEDLGRIKREVNKHFQGRFCENVESKVKLDEWGLIKYHRFGI